MATVDTQSSLVIVKSFEYRGSTQLWTNRYHTTGPLTLTLAEFETLVDAVVAAEKEPLVAEVTMVEAIWNDASTATSTNPHGDAVFTKTLDQPGVMPETGGTKCPGDCAAVVRYSTDARSVKNKPIYLFNYYHGVLWDNSHTPDDLLNAQINAFNAYATAWLTGFSDGTNTHVRCGPRGAVANDNFTLRTIRHRDFPT